MENKCSYRQLDGVINNNAFMKFNELRVTFVNNRNYERRITFRSIDTADFITLSFSSAVTINNLSMQVIAQNVTSFSMDGYPGIIISISANTTVTMSVDKKYNIFMLNANIEDTIVYKGIGGLINCTEMQAEYCPIIQGVNIEDYKNSEGLKSLSFVSEGIIGDVAALSGLTSLSKLKLKNAVGVTGDANIFADSSKFTSLANLDIRGSGIINRTAAVKALIEAAHPGITVQL